MAIFNSYVKLPEGMSPKFSELSHPSSQAIGLDIGPRLRPFVILAHSEVVVKQ